MSIYSTMSIKREDAQKLILSKVFNLTDKEMEDLLFTLYADKTLYNFSIVSEYEGSDDYGYPIQYKGRESDFR